jgi:hypothetical protein
MQLLTGGKDYIGLVKEFIEKIFKHEAKKFKCDEADLSIILERTRDGNIQIMTYSKPQGIILRTIYDKEVQEILMK